MYTRVEEHMVGRSQRVDQPPGGPPVISLSSKYPCPPYYYQVNALHVYLFPCTYVLVLHEYMYMSLASRT